MVEVVTPIVKSALHLSYTSVPLVVRGDSKDIRRFAPREYVPEVALLLLDYGHAPSCIGVAWDITCFTAVSSLD